MKSAVFLTIDDRFRTLGYAQAVHLARTQSVDVHLFDEGEEDYPYSGEVTRLTIHRRKLACLIDAQLPASRKWPHVVYGRLFVPQVLRDYDRLLYLDADIAVMGDLSALLSIDMGGNVLAAVHDADLWGDKSPIAGRATKYDWLRSIGVKADRYFNSGVLLINVMQYHGIDIAVDLAAYFRDYAAMITMWDQDFLNYRFQGSWKELSPVWNFQAISIDSGFSELLHPVIYHFNEVQKPWHRGYYFGSSIFSAYFHRIADEAGVDFSSFPRFHYAGFQRRSKYAIRNFLYRMGLRWKMPPRRVKEALDRRAGLVAHFEEVVRTGRYEVDVATLQAMNETRFVLRFNGNEVWNDPVWFMPRDSVAPSPS